MGAGCQVNRNRDAFANGIRDGFPIALGYFAVAFSLGIVAKKAGLNPFQGFLSSILNHASAGEYAEFTVIMANAPYFEMVFVVLIEVYFIHFKFSSDPIKTV